MYRIHLFTLGHLVPQDIWCNKRQEAVSKLKEIFSYAKNVYVRHEDATEDTTIDIVVDYDATNSQGTLTHYRRHFTMVN